MFVVLGRCGNYIWEIERDISDMLQTRISGVCEASLPMLWNPVLFSEQHTLANGSARSRTCQFQIPAVEYLKIVFRRGNVASVSFSIFNVRQVYCFVKYYEQLFAEVASQHLQKPNNVSIR